MFKKYAMALLTVAAAFTATARINSFGDPAYYGLAESPDQWYEVNPYTWDVFTSFDGDKIFGVNDERRTVLQAEFYSTGVMEGRKVGDFTAVASLTDRSAFFGGDGYLDLYYFAPVDANKYAQQIAFFGGWKYNVLKYVDIDIGGNIIYSTKPVVGPGMVVKNMGGETLRGDIYVGFTTDKLYVNPFVFAGYDPTYDELRFTAGIGPKFGLEELTNIRGLYAESKCLLGYVRAQRFSGSEVVGGGYWRNEYSYIQTEANLVYEYKHLRTFAGVGWAIHNDGEYAPNGEYLGGDNNVWVGGGIGWIF